MEKDVVDYFECARSRKVKYAEPRRVFSNKEAPIFKNGVLDSCSTSVDGRFGVRILADGGLGFISSNKWTRKAKKLERFFRKN